MAIEKNGTPWCRLLRQKSGRIRQHVMLLNVVFPSAVGVLTVMTTVCGVFGLAVRNSTNLLLASAPVTGRLRKSRPVGRDVRVIISGV